jgi:hypothetical protein
VRFSAGLEGYIMRKSIMVGFAAIVAGSTSSVALPVDTALPREANVNVTPVQMVCDYSRCIDRRTGAYTQSTCSRGVCRPMSGIIGYADPGRVARDYAGPRTHYGRRYNGGHRDYGGYGYGGYGGYGGDVEYGPPPGYYSGPPRGYYDGPPRGWD